MLVLTRKQMLAFEQSAQQAFEDEMLEHVSQFSPPLYKTLGEAQTRKALVLAMAQAKHHGFTQRGPVRTYVEQMLLLGSHFDSDPQYPWATEILTMPDLPQMERAELLYTKTLDYLEKVVGPEDAFSLAALRHVAMFAQQPLHVTTQSFVQDMLRELSQIYPQKAAYMGAQAMEQLIHKGLAGAQRQRFNSLRGAVLVIVLMFAFGHGCGADPWYPWISKTLGDSNDADPEAKVKRLEKNALTWLEHVIAYFEAEAPA